jgi:hypothetical protein
MKDLVLLDGSYWLLHFPLEGDASSEFFSAASLRPDGLFSMYASSEHYKSTPVGFSAAAWTIYVLFHAVMESKIRRWESTLASAWTTTRVSTVVVHRIIGFHFLSARFFRRRKWTFKRFGDEDMNMSISIL